MPLLKIHIKQFNGFKNTNTLHIKNYPVSIYFFKVTIEKLEKGVKYVQN